MFHTTYCIQYQYVTVTQMYIITSQCYLLAEKYEYHEPGFILEWISL